MSARNIRVEETTDYDKFVTLSGNRRLNQRHVKSLRRKMADEGNLTQVFPIVVNQNMEVIDGQHRLEALRQLEWPVFYEVKPDLTIETVEALNTGTQNWTWFDYAFSYAERGNQNYVRFLNLWDHFNMAYGIILGFATGIPMGGNRAAGFRKGDLEFSANKQKETFKLLKQYKEITEAAGHNTSGFANALLQVMRLPEYDHNRMLRKMTKYSGGLKRYSSREDYMRAIEDIYNTYVHEDEKVRLF